MIPSQLRVDDEEMQRAVRSQPTHYSDMLLLGVGVASVSSIGPWALVAHATATNSGSSGVGNFTTPIKTTTGATLLVVAVAWYNGGSAPSVSDNKGNTWHALTAYAGGNGSMTLFYALATTVGAGHTFTVSSASFASCAMAAFSGGTGTFDQQAGAGSASAPTQQPGSVTPTLNNELLVTAVCIGDNGFTVSADPAYTITDSFMDATNTCFGVSLAYLNQGTVAAVSNPTWTTSSGSHRLAAAVATFEA